MQPWSNKSETELYLEGCDSVFVGQVGFWKGDIIFEGATPLFVGDWAANLGGDGQKMGHLFCFSIYNLYICLSLGWEPLHLSVF